MIVKRDNTAWNLSSMCALQKIWHLWFRFYNDLGLLGVCRPMFGLLLLIRCHYYRTQSFHAFNSIFKSRQLINMNHQRIPCFGQFSAALTNNFIIPGLMKISHNLNETNKDAFNWELFMLLKRSNVERNRDVRCGRY